jgi:hypothetical protein
VLNVQAALAIVDTAVAEGSDEGSDEKSDQKTGPEALSTDMLARLNFYPEDVQTLIEKSTVVDSWLEAVGG